MNKNKQYRTIEVFELRSKIFVWHDKNRFKQGVCSICAVLPIQKRPDKTQFSSPVRLVKCNYLYFCVQKYAKCFHKCNFLQFFQIANANANANANFS